MSKSRIFTLIQSSIAVTWDGWTDDDSGLKEYRIDLIPLKVYDLSADDPVLQPEHIIAFDTVVDASKVSLGRFRFTQQKR